MATKIKLKGLDVHIRCLDCREPLPLDELMTVKTLADLVEHVQLFNHELVITARRKP